MKALAALVTLLVLCGPAGSAIAADGSQASLEPIVSHKDWLNGAVSAVELRGKVVVVDVFTFGCYNCANVRPNLQALYRKRGRDVEIVGVHTPETGYERERANVVANLARQGVVWPVAVDNDQTLWNAYRVDAWPTQLIFDRHGVLRKTVVGDSQDAAVDEEVRALVAERSP